MADAKTEQEPSIEEILESIRQIISEDADTTAAAAPAPKPLNLNPTPVNEPASKPLNLTPAPAEDFSSDLVLVDEPEDNHKSNLDLSQAPETYRKLDLDLNLSAAAPQPADDILDLTEVVAPVQSQGTSPMEQTDAPNLISDSTADAATAAMARLLASNVAIEREVPGRVSGVTLEDLAREMMRPLVKTWVDQNLPKVVEKLVAREIEKLSRRAMEQ